MLKPTVYDVAVSFLRSGLPPVSCESWPRIASGMKLVVLPFPYRWVNAACFEHGVPYITMSHFPPFARVGPMYVPGETGCFNCQERAYRQTYELYDHIIEQRRGSPSPAATLGPVCAFVGGQVALEVVHELTGLCRPASKGMVRVFDTRTLGVTEEAVPRDPACEVCR